MALYRTIAGQTVICLRPVQWHVFVAESLPPFLRLTGETGIILYRHPVNVTLRIVVAPGNAFLINWLTYRNRVVFHAVFTHQVARITALPRTNKSPHNLNGPLKLLFQRRCTVLKHYTLSRRLFCQAHSRPLAASINGIQIEEKRRNPRMNFTITRSDSPKRLVR